MSDRRRWFALVAILLGALSLGSCSKSEPASVVRVIDAFATPGQEAVAVYLRLSNAGGSDDIVGASVAGFPSAQQVTLHKAKDRDGLSVMVPTDRIQVPARGESALGPGDAHLMLEGVSVPLDAGDGLQLVVEFDRAGPAEIDVEVIPLTDALDRINAPIDEAERAQA